jgi:hypothetical protein
MMLYIVLGFTGLMLLIGIGIGAASERRAMKREERKRLAQLERDMRKLERREARQLRRQAIAQKLIPWRSKP